MDRLFTIRHIAMNTARRFQNSTFVRINLEDSYVDVRTLKDRSISLGCGALDALSQIDEALANLSGK